MKTHKNKANDQALLIRSVYDACRELGYLIDDIGVCQIESLSRLISCRALKSVPARGTVIVFAVPFYSGEYVDRNVALYAVPNDYHTVIGDMLVHITDKLKTIYTENVFLPFVDSSPIPEVEAACRAGLGVYGLNGQLITSRFGSYVFICEIVTDLVVPVVENEIKSCIQCGRCVKACPTGALNFSLFQKERCRSFITQKKGLLDSFEEEEIRRGGLAWGCDICTRVCPLNSHPQMSGVRQMHENLIARIDETNLDDLLITKSYGWRGKTVLLRNLKILEKRK